MTRDDGPPDAGTTIGSPSDVPDGSAATGGAVHEGHRASNVVRFPRAVAAPDADLDAGLDVQGADGALDQNAADDARPVVGAPRFRRWRRRAEPSASTESTESTSSVDWPWVEEWRAGGEPAPWGPGLALAAFTAIVVGVAVWVLSAGLIDRPTLAVGVNLLVAGGLTPAMWLSRDLPVLRWIALGGVIGMLGGWIAALSMLSVA